METDFITELNEAMQEGIPTPQTKKCELIPKIAVSLHIISHLFGYFNENNRAEISEEIPLDVFNQASYFVEIVEQQKDIYSTVRINMFYYICSILSFLSCINSKF